MQFGLFYLLAGVWLFMYPVFALPWIAVSFVLDELHLVGSDASVLVFAFGGGFCLGGTLDALWRAILAKKARSRYKRANQNLDQVSNRLLRIAQANDGTTLIQIAIGLIFAFQVWKI